jgi:hypothetical protein
LEAMSKTKLATQAPIGRVTRIGWAGWPYGPVSGDLGCFAGRELDVGVVVMRVTGSFASGYRHGVVDGIPDG